MILVPVPSSHFLLPVFAGLAVLLLGPFNDRVAAAQENASDNVNVNINVNNNVNHPKFWSYEEDLIESLPGYAGRALPTRQYSGYLDATAGCDTQVNGDYCHLHYWLCTAKSNSDGSKSDDREGESDSDDTGIPSIPRPRPVPLNQQGDGDDTIPIVVWFNGGPGASSMVGLFQELGPLLLNQDGTLIENPFAWTNVAHLLVLESPVGVGYSTCQAEQTIHDSDQAHADTDDQDSDDNDDDDDDDDDISSSCANTDHTTASAARAALVSFFGKFPHLASNDLYLTGESYAGVYVPTLAYEILQFNSRAYQKTGLVQTINLQGILVADPCTDNTAQRESTNPLWYGHQYGLVDDAVYDTLTNDPLCHQWLRQRQSDEWSTFNEYRPTVASAAMHRRRNTTTNSITTRHQLLRQSWQRPPPPSCLLAYRKYLLSSSRGIDGKWNQRYVDRFSLFAPVTNKLNEALETYMNRPDVQEAIHVTPVKARPWAIHAVDFDYTKQYHACNRWADSDNSTDTKSMIDFYRKIIPRLRATWILNGNADPAVSYEGTRVAVRRIGLPELDGGGYRPWFYNQSAIAISVDFLRDKPILFGPDLTLSTATGVQFGGEVINYQDNLAFIMVHGSGHMIPQFRPNAALHILTKLLSSGQNGAPLSLSPLTPPNDTLATMNLDTFHEAVNAWTEHAKSTQYVS